MIGDSVSTSLLKRALDGTWQRQKVIANNIANHETPGYKAIRVNFEQALKHEVSRINPSTAKNSDLKSIENSNINHYIDRGVAQRIDGNSVDLDKENIEMAKTQIQYQYLTKTLSDMYSRLKFAINEGKR